jgi:hypothetical protein
VIAPPGPNDPAQALRALAEQLRGEETVIAPHVVEPGAAPALGLLAAACPRGSEAPAEYAQVVESVREGYLLHYGEPRILRPDDPDLSLLAGDYLYARGIERLAALGDTEAVRELGDLISLSAECHAEGRLEVIPPLWLAATIAVGSGGEAGHEAAKEGARALEASAADRLWEAARARAERLGVGDALERAAEGIDFPTPRVDPSG